MVEKQNVQHKIVVKGRNIYYDEKGRCIYFHKRKNIGYILLEENIKSYTMYSQRYYLAFIAVILSNLVFERLANVFILSFIIGVAVLLILEFRFQKSFLPSLGQLKNFQPKVKLTYIQTLAQDDTWKIITKAILFPLVGVLIILNNQMKETTLEYSIIGYVALLIGVIISIFHIQALLSKRNK